MTKFLIRFLGLPGSWTWACRQMDKGKIVYRTTDTGAAKYRLDFEDNRRIICAFVRGTPRRDNWMSAYIFLSDFECTAWAVWAGEEINE